MLSCMLAYILTQIFCLFVKQLNRSESKRAMSNRDQRLRRPKELRKMQTKHLLELKTNAFFTHV